jgi:4-amino-4-deoxy-L-arabinose transferase-like glycosyltransferase
LLILPDTPQIFFVLLSFYFGIPAITSLNPSKKDSYNIILFGLFAGLAFLSKYHSLFLWFGFGLYVFTINRQWLKKPFFYISLLITLILMTPVIYWNIKNHFISFTFHGSRVGLFNSPFDLSSFLQFNLGQILYQNPVLFIMFILTLVSLFRKKDRLTNINILLLYLSLPLILIFILFSLFKNTFPHWTGPAFIGLIILSSEWLSEKLNSNRRRVINTIIGANALVVLMLIFTPLQVNYGLLNISHEEIDPHKIGENDISLDMYGWKQASVKFQQFLKKEGIQEKDHHRVKIISNKWFPAAHLDFYIAHPLKIDLLVSGTLRDAHKYFWINQKRSIGPGDQVYYLTTSRQFFDPENLIWNFNKITPVDTLEIKRNRETVYEIFIFQMNTNRKLP